MRDVEAGRRARYIRERDFAGYILLVEGAGVAVGLWYLAHPVVGVIAGFGFLLWFAAHLQEARRERDEGPRRRRRTP